MSQGQQENIESDLPDQEMAPISNSENAATATVDAIRRLDIVGPEYLAKKFASLTPPDSDHISKNMKWALESKDTLLVEASTIQDEGDRRLIEWYFVYIYGEMTVFPPNLPVNSWEILYDLSSTADSDGKRGLLSAIANAIVYLYNESPSSNIESALAALNVVPQVKPSHGVEAIGAGKLPASLKQRMEEASKSAKQHGQQKQVAEPDIDLTSNASSEILSCSGAVANFSLFFVSSRGVVRVAYLGPSIERFAN